MRASACLSFQELSLDTPRLSLCLIAMIATATFACGGGDSGNDGSGTSLASCNAQCDAQENVRGKGCEPFVPLADCKQICAQLVKNVKGCGAQFNAYYDCSAADGFVCAGPLVTNTTNACDDELAALNRCSNGGGNAGSGSSACKGATASGVCPRVACPCPEGSKMVSGFATSADGCACLDATTCKDLFCD